MLGKWVVHAKEMGIHAREMSRPNAEIIDETPEGQQFDYFRPEGIITYTIDRMFDVFEVEINFNS